MRASVFFKWLRGNWVGILSLIVAAGAMGYAREANRISADSAKVTRQLAKLGLRPMLRIHGMLNPNGDRLPRLEIQNWGPVDAVHIRVRIITHRYSEKSHAIGHSATMPSADLKLAKLPPNGEHEFSLAERLLPIEDPAQYSVCELRISYRRPQDLLEYAEAAFYFVNHGGNWVSERDRSLWTPLHVKIRAALEEHLMREDLRLYEVPPGGDLLHPMAPRSN